MNGPKSIRSTKRIFFSDDQSHHAIARPNCCSNERQTGVIYRNDNHLAVHSKEGQSHTFLHHTHAKCDHTRLRYPTPLLHLFLFVVISIYNFFCYFSLLVVWR